jgi:hypothetical protein
MVVPTRLPRTLRKKYEIYSPENPNESARIGLRSISGITYRAPFTPPTSKM